MVTIGTPKSKNATKILLLGSGELGKEVAIEAQRYGVEVIAVDRYANAPAMQVAHRAEVINMQDPTELFALITEIQPNYIVPEVEAIATETLVKLEESGFVVIPTARAVHLTMNREGIRCLVAEQLHLPTSPYRFANTLEECKQSIKELGFPCVIKPVMSSSGKGQSIIRSREDILPAWEHSQAAGRTGAGRVIIEGYVPFDFEITLLTVRHCGGTLFCDPIGHWQQDGDYRESWQPHPMPHTLLKKAQKMAMKVTDALGGYGLFGVELFIQGEDVLFSEVSPRPHDTGMVTMISQSLSEFALHVRAILGLPIPNLLQWGPSASCAILAEGKSQKISYQHLEKALVAENTEIRLFGKSTIAGKRRLAVALARGSSIEEARQKACAAAKSIQIDLDN